MNAAFGDESMVSHRIHILGASGTGTSTLGSELAQALGARFLDVDSYYWLPTDPPFTSKRDPVERVRMLEADTEGVQSWVLAGSMCGWGDAFRENFTLVVFLSLESNERMVRLAAREGRLFGSRIAPGGDMHAQHLAFMDWANSYDEAAPPTRSRRLHDRWLEGLHCPTIRLDSSQSLPDLCRLVRQEILCSNREDAERALAPGDPLRGPRVK